jgi:leucine-rich repeat-containing protein 49
MQNKESNRLFSKMGNDIISGSEKKENNFMTTKSASFYNTDSKKVKERVSSNGFTMSDQKGLQQIKPNDLCIQLLGNANGPTKGPIKATQASILGSTGKAVDSTYHQFNSMEKKMDAKTFYPKMHQDRNPNMLQNTLSIESVASPINSRLLIPD